MKHVRQIMFPCRGFGWDRLEEVLIEYDIISAVELATVAREYMNGF